MQCCFSSNHCNGSSTVVQFKISAISPDQVINVPSIAHQNLTFSKAISGDVAWLMV